jgi:ABC-type Na+ efflux pump permease subunit
MDVPLYAVALAFFAVLYLAIGVFLVYTILIALVAMFMFLTLRYGNVSESYPHSASDVSITAIFIGITWAIFVFVGPKNPIPFFGNGFTYQSATVVPTNSIVAISVVVLIAFLGVFAFAADKLPHMAGGAPSGGGGGSSAQSGAESTQSSQADRAGVR